MQLIERFYDPASGRVLIDGRPIQDYNIKSLRHHIGYVGQEPVLFNTTIRENLLLGNENATEPQLIEALKRAQAYDFVMEQHDKLETKVGTSGSKLSGGQKQRIAIARAILKDPKILLLDEATSALDRTNEAAIQRTLDEVSVGRTTIIIAHRLSTVRDADTIFVLDKGIIVESGRHEELMNKRGRYYELVQNQQHAKQEGIAAPQDVAVEIQSPSPGRRQDAHLQSEEVSPLKEGIKRPNEEETPKRAEVMAPGSTKGLYFRLYTLSKADIPYILIGFLASIGNGTIFPLMTLPLANYLQQFTVPGSDSEQVINSMALFYVWLALGSFSMYFIQHSMLNYVADKLSARLRETIFGKMLQMHIGWFDEEKHTPGALASLLAADAQVVNKLTGSVIGICLQAVSGLTTGLIIAFFGSWKLALVTMALSPAMILAGAAQAHFAQGFSDQSDAAYKQASSLVSDSVGSMRTVASFGNEGKILKIYDGFLAEPSKAAAKKGHVTGFFFGISQFAMFGMNAICFYAGTLFMRSDGMTIKDFYQAMLGAIFAAFDMGQISQFMPDWGSANQALVRIFNIIDQKSKIDAYTSGQLKTPIRGQIEFQNVSFKYPTRSKQVLKNFNLSIKPGQKIALVGPSGCGKSTIIQLLQRFYDIDEGRILVDGVDIKSYDLHHWRQQLGIVSQEPILFNGTIEYNIKYANEKATEAEMKEAAKLANALTFIEKNEFQESNEESKGKSALGTGFQRLVGTKGSQLSGGQKQRIAIARAVLKNPKIYLFDEATSALDSVSEQVVQEALNGLMTDHTSIAIAHRLSTIRNVDEILVLRDGEVIERGSYDDLLKMKGTFYNMAHGL
jgi:ATP-binding cassette subfamily B (MDR/TAP) protein 1